MSIIGEHTHTANGNSPWNYHQGGRIIMSIDGVANPDGGTVKIQFSNGDPEDANFATSFADEPTASTLTQSGNVGVELGSCYVRTVMSSATSPNCKVRLSRSNPL